MLSVKGTQALLEATGLIGISGVVFTLSLPRVSDQGRVLQQLTDCFPHE